MYMFHDEYNIKRPSNAMIGLRSVKNYLLNCWMVICCWNNWAQLYGCQVRLFEAKRKKKKKLNYLLARIDVVHVFYFQRTKDILDPLKIYWYSKWRQIDLLEFGRFVQIWKLFAFIVTISVKLTHCHGLHMPEQVLIPCGGSFERGATDAASAEDVATAADNHTMPCFGSALPKVSKMACNSKSCENWTRPRKILIPMCPNKLSGNYVVSLGGMVHLNQI